MSEKELHFLNNSWTLWFHNPESDDWGENSYIKIYKFNTIEQFWALFNKIPQLHLSTGMYFLMKEDILPLWEDTNNIKGGCWSYKVSKKEASQAYLDLLKTIISENTCPDNPDIINGASISPKKGFCIIKVWNNDSKYSDPNLLSEEISNIDISQTIYKAYS
tara:strand:+ start:604 stop:1089 length:486 start_codon:yes stop_codon:yes gene_type:complete